MLGCVAISDFLELLNDAQEFICHLAIVWIYVDSITSSKFLLAFFINKKFARTLGFVDKITLMLENMAS